MTRQRMMAEKKKICIQCRWFIPTVDGKGFCKFYEFLCSTEDEACNAIIEKEE